MDLCVRNLGLLLTMEPGAPDLGALPDAAVAFSDGRVQWIGSDDQAPSAEVELDGRGQLGMPGLVDAHTHAVWAGTRADEFRRRLAGANYSEILEAGGGILSTVAATREASDATLLALAVDRLRFALSQGITTVEVKSGYGLSPEHELRMLQVAKRAAREVGLRIRTTFLGAHTVPAEHRPHTSRYVDQVIREQIPQVAPEADMIDVYIDRGAFSVEEGQRILEAGKARGLGVRAHAEQVTHTGAARMAAELGALSCDHLERVDDAGIAAMAKAGTVAVVLPTPMLYLRDQPPPVAALREAGVPLAVATDLNPGSSPAPDLWTAMTLACLTMGMSVEEVVIGVTRHAAQAIGCPDLGRLQVGGPGDLAVLPPPPGEPPSIASFVQRMGGHRATVVVRDGQVIVGRAAT